MSIESPFKFLDSYTKEDKDIFFGRENEIEEIYSRVFQSQLLLVYGASGTGKSSLIQCGLANKFEDADWQPISIRRGLNINDSILQQLNKLALTPLKPAKDESKALVKPLKSIYLDYFKPIYLIFDQFEELFIFGERDEWLNFIQSIKTVLDSDINVKLIFVIRGEYLEYLSEFEDIVPEFFNNRIRIEKMTRQSALRCITGPCERFSIELEKDFPENLLHKLSPEKSEIELTYLQVFLDRIYKGAQSSSNSENITFTQESLENLGNIGDVLSEFLDEQIDQTEDKELSLALLKAFVTSQGTKKQVSVKDAKDFINILGHVINEQKTEKLILDLVNRRILKDKDEADHYELRHDSIAAKIYQKITQYEKDLIEVKSFLEYAYGEHLKRGFMLNESDLAYVLPYRDRLILSKEIDEFIDKSAKVDDKRKRGRKQLYIVVVTISVLLLGSIAMFLYAISSQRAAETNLELAKVEASRAEEQQKVAEQERIRAEKSAVLADSAAEEALIQRSIAEKNAEIATLRSIQAQRQKERADANADSALLMSQRALQQESLAIKNAEIAAKNAEEANKLRYLSIAKSIATKSLQVKEVDLKLLLALQAKQFNEAFEGYKFDADIYAGLYSAKIMLNGNNYNKQEKYEGPVQAIEWMGDDLISASGDGEANIIFFDGNMFQNQSTLLFDGYINDMSVAPDNLSVAFAFQEGFIEIVDLKNPDENKRIELDQSDPVFQLDHLADGKIVYATDNGIIGLISSQDTVFIEHHKSRITGLQTHLNNTFIGYEDGSLRQIRGGQEFLSLPTMNNGAVTQIGINEVNNYLIIGYENGGIIIIDQNNKTVLQNLSAHESGISSIKFSPDGQLMITGSLDRTLRIWNLSNLSELPITVGNHTDWVISSEFIEGGSMVVTGDASGNFMSFPVDLNDLSIGMCEELDRNLKTEEWDNYIGQGLKYQETCPKIGSR